MRCSFFATATTRPHAHIHAHVRTFKPQASASAGEEDDVLTKLRKEVESHKSEAEEAWQKYEAQQGAEITCYY